MDGDLVMVRRCVVQFAKRSARGSCSAVRADISDFRRGIGTKSAVKGVVDVDVLFAE